MTSPPRLDPLRHVFDLARHGNRIALAGPEGAVTYRQLDGRVERQAQQLGRGRRLVLISAASTTEAVVGYLAALRGEHVAMLAAARDRHAMASLVRAYDPDVIIDNGIHQRRRGAVHDLHPQLALLASTSGSTGTPKLVRISHRNLYSNAAAIAEYLELTPHDRAITTLPMQYCYGLSVINSHLHAGASVVLTDCSVVDPRFWELLDRHAATSFAGVPHTFELLDRIGFDGKCLPTLRYVTQAGGRMAPDVVRRYAELGEQCGWDLFVMYGQTEATARMAYLPPGLATARPNAVGVAVPGGAFEIVSPDHDGIGEVVYRGPNVMLGYATCPDDLAQGRMVTELATGDVGRIASDGLLEIVGRRSRIIKPFGVRIDLDDLERELRSRQVRSVCTGDDGSLAVVVDPTVDIGLARQTVDALVRLPVNHIRIVQLDEVPRLATGKVDYVVLRSSLERSVPATPRGPDVRATVAQVLNVEAGDDDTFASLGGDSLSYVEMSVRLEALLGHLPADWHLLPINELESLRRQERPPRRWTRIDATLVVRAVGIVLVTGTHSGLWYLPGGAHAMLAVAGFNYARFQLHGTRPWASIARTALPSMAWIGVVAASTDEFGWPQALLLNHLAGPPGSRWAYWFVEALVSILVLATVTLAIPAVARAQRQRPFHFASGVAAVGLLIRFDVIVDLSNGHPTSRPHEVLWLFALGWAGAEARGTGQRLAVTAGAIAATVGFFHDGHRELLVVGAIALVTWLTTVPVPPPIAGAVYALAGASLSIYLTQFQLYPTLRDATGPAGATAGCLLAGIIAWQASRWLPQARREMVQKVTTRTIRRRAPLRALVD